MKETAAILVQPPKQSQPQIQPKESKKKAAAPAPKALDKTVSFFSHLPQYEKVRSSRNFTNY